MPTLREKLWGASKPLREKLATMAEKTDNFSPITMTVKGLGKAGEVVDDALGLPGRVATGFNDAVPKGFSEQVGQATEAVTGSKTAGSIAGFAAGMAEPMGASSKVVKIGDKVIDAAKLKPKYADAVARVQEIGEDAFQRARAAIVDRRNQYPSYSLPYRNADDEYKKMTETILMYDDVKKGLKGTLKSEPAKKFAVYRSEKPNKIDGKHLGNAETDGKFSFQEEHFNDLFAKGKVDARDFSKTEVEFKNPLVVADEDMAKMEDPAVALWKKWFGDKPVPFSKEEGRFLRDKLVAEEAVRRGHDGIVYGSREVQDLRNLKNPADIQKKIVEQMDKIAETDTSAGFVKAYNVVSANLRDPAMLRNHVLNNIEGGRVPKKWGEKLLEMIDKEGSRGFVTPGTAIKGGLGATGLIVGGTIAKEGLRKAEEMGHYEWTAPEEAQVIQAVEAEEPKVDLSKTVAPEEYHGAIIRGIEHLNRFVDTPDPSGRQYAQLNPEEIVNLFNAENGGSWSPTKGNKNIDYGVSQLNASKRKDLRDPKTAWGASWNNNFKDEYGDFDENNPEHQILGGVIVYAYARQKLTDLFKSGELKREPTQEDFIVAYNMDAKQVADAINGENYTLSITRNDGTTGEKPLQQQYRDYLNHVKGSSTTTHPQDETSQDIEVPKSFENYLINRGDTISTDRSTIKDSVSRILDKAKTKVPFMDTNFEKAVRKEISKAYPLTPKAKKIINDININEITSDKFNGLYKAVRGEKTWKAVGKVMNNEALAKLVGKLPNKIFSTAIGEEMNLSEASARVAMHEGLHGLFQRSTFDPQEFLNDWNTSKNQSYPIDAEYDNKGYQSWVEEKMATDPLYKNGNMDDKVNEMFAYLGEMAGSQGLRAIPPPLKKYYSDIFTEQTRP